MFEFLRTAYGILAVMNAVFVFSVMPLIVSLNPDGIPNTPKIIFQRIISFLIFVAIGVFLFLFIGDNYIFVPGLISYVVSIFVAVFIKIKDMRDNAQNQKK